MQVNVRKSEELPAPYEQSWTLWGGAVRVIILGRPHDFRFNLKKQLPGTVAVHLDRIAKREGIERAFCPIPTFTGNVVTSAFFDTEVERETYSLFYQKHGEGEGDGVELAQKGDAFVYAPGDCHTLTVRNPLTAHVLSAHGGLKNFANPKVIKDGLENSGRRYESIVDEMYFLLRHLAIADFGEEYFDPAQLQVHISCGIEPENFGHAHPSYEAFNKKMREYLVDKYGRDVITDWDGCRIDMPELIARQFCRSDRCVLPENITHDGMDTYTHRAEDNEFALWSNKREGENGYVNIATGLPPRNLMIVVRNEIMQPINPGFLR